MAQEKVDGRRTFDILTEDGNKTYYIGMPTADQIKRADWHYSKVYNKALVEGLATSSEMLDTLKSRGLYSTSYEEQQEELRSKVAAAILSMETSTNEIEKYNLAIQIKQLREDLYQWNQRVSSPMRNTCEQTAEDAKIEFLTSLIVQDKDGKPVWKSYDEFLNAPDQFLSMRARVEVYLWAQGLDRNFLDNTPEQKVIDHYLVQKIEDAQKKLVAENESVEVVENPEDLPPPVEEVKVKKVRAKKA